MVLRRRYIAFVASFAAALLFACGSSTTRQCNVGADCASGACNADGTCVGAAGGDAGKDGAADGASSLADGASTTEAGMPFPGTDGGGCIANKDGVISAAEVPLIAGLNAKFVVATTETIDTAGAKNPDGTRTWDFTGKLASDQEVIISTLSVTGAYYAKDFPKATYASKLSQEATLLGVFETGTDALSLLGVVSPTTGGASDTELTYDTPIAILKFPFMASSTWTTTSNAGGTYNGTTIASAFYTEKYETTVDATGTVKTPFADFPSLRVGTLLTQTVNYGAYQTITITRSYAWVTECYGTIAKATSTAATATGIVAPAAPVEDFTQAAELMRLTP